MVFSSFKKEETPRTNNPEVVGNNFDKTVTFHDTALTNTNTYAYDAGWRIISSEGDDNFTVDCATGTVTYASETGQLNSNGYLVSKSDGTTNTNDNNCYLISKSDDVITTQYFWSADGNHTKEISLYASGGETSTPIYVYDLSKLNPIRGTERLLQGKSSKNIITSISYSSSFDSSSTLTFSYIYDSKGSSAVMNQTVGASQFKFGFTYFD